MRHGHRAALGALVVAFALLFFAEGAALPTAWLPVEEAAVLEHARGGGSAESSSGILYPALLAPAAHSLSPLAAHRFAKALSALLWASLAIPAYVLARRLVPPGPALAVAALSVAAPASVYATAAVPDGLALLLAVSSLPLLARASERGNERDLLGAIALASAAALTRPWFVVLPPALLVAYELSRKSRRSFLRWPRSLAFAGLAAFGYLVLATTASDVGNALASPEALAGAVVAGLVVVAFRAAWAAQSAPARPETALLATCLPALILAAGVFGAAEPGFGVEARPLLMLVPLVLALAASAGLGAPRRRRYALPATLAVLLLAGHAVAFSSVRSEARKLAAAEPTPRDWVDRNAGSGSHVFVVGPPGAIDERSLAELILWNRSVRGRREIDLSTVDPTTGLLPDSGSDLALVRGTELAGKEIARSVAGVLLRPPLGVAETVEGLFPDGWSGDHAFYRRFAGPPKAGTVLVTVSRVAWGGHDRPADVRVDSGPLNGTGEQRAHIIIHAGKELELAIPVPPPPFQIAMTVQPTFAPAEFGATDTRQLGAQVRFRYRPGK